MPDKWRHWILAPRGHGPDWERVFGVEPDDSELVWTAIASAVGQTPISTIRDRTPYGVVCGLEMTLTIKGRTALVATAWHYADPDASPRLVTAYPSP